MVYFSLLTTNPQGTSLSWSYKTHQIVLLMYIGIHILFASIGKLDSSFLLLTIAKSSEREGEKTKSSKQTNKQTQSLLTFITTLKCGLVFLVGIPLFHSFDSAS